MRRHVNYPQSSCKHNSAIGLHNMVPYPKNWLLKFQNFKLLFYPTPSDLVQILDYVHWSAFFICFFFPMTQSNSDQNADQKWNTNSLILNFRCRIISRN